MSMSIALLILFLVFMFLGVPIAGFTGSCFCNLYGDDVGSSTFYGGTVNVYINEQFTWLQFRCLFFAVR